MKPGFRRPWRSRKAIEFLARSPTFPSARSILKLDTQLSITRRMSSGTREQAGRASSGKCKNSPLPLDGEDKSKVSSLLGLPEDILDKILAKLEYKQSLQAKSVCKAFKASIEGDGYCAHRGNLHPREGRLTALHFSIRHDGIWRCAGLDLDSNSWKKLPPFRMLPILDAKLFKDHLICGAGGIMCAYVSAISSRLTHLEKIVVFHPLTGRWSDLPPLHHPRSPVLMQMVVSPTGDSFKIIVAGSGRVADNERLSKITEVFDSVTSTWTVTEEVPGPFFSLNEHQTGAYKDGVLYCVAFLDGDRGRGLLAFSVDEGKWLPELTCPLPAPHNLNNVQVANINGEVVVFSEVEHNPYSPHRTVDHRIDILDTNSAGEGATVSKWRNVLTETKDGNQTGLLVYPEYTCLPFGEGELCVFNTVEHTGEIYDVKSGDRTYTLTSPTWNCTGELNFYSMNPITFDFEPTFKSNLNFQLAHGSGETVSLE